MADLAAIWDDDAELASTSRPPAEPLFIHGGESDAEPESRARAPAAADDAELEAMFNEEALELIDTRAVLARAEEQARRADARRPQKKPERHQILPSSSPPPEGFDEAGGAGGKKEGEKKRRRPVVLDEARLISPVGFPQLIEDTRDFKIKGKGHEAVDLNRLLNIYQFWAHRMYPRTQFDDTVERVEKLCHSNRMRNQLSMMRDAAFGKAPVEDAIDLSDSDNEGLRHGATEPPRDGTAPPPSSPPRSSPPASRPPSAPPDSSDPGDAPMADGTHSSADEDAALWAEFEEENDAMLAAKAPAPPRPPASDFVDDMDDAFAVFDEVHGGGAPPPPAPGFDQDMDDDFAMMDAMEAEQQGLPRHHAPPKPGEGEKERPTEGAPTTTSGPAPAASPAKPRTTSDVEDEWIDEDMYADD